MRLRMKAKLTTIMIAAVAVATVAGAGAVMASQSHSPSSSSPHTSDGAASQQTPTTDANDPDDQNGQGDDSNHQDDHTLVGVIQSVDQSAQTFVLLPDGKTTPVTIAFDAKSTTDADHDDGANHATLVQGAHVRVEVVTRADGSLYAEEIEPASAPGGDDGDDSGHNGQPTPTSTPGTGGGGSGD